MCQPRLRQIRHRQLWKQFDNFLKRWRNRFVICAGANLQIRQQVQPMRHKFGRCVALLNQLLQFIRRQIQPLKMSRVNDREFFPPLVRLMVLKHRKLNRARLSQNQWDERSIHRYQHLLKREHPTCTERISLTKECGWKHGDKGGLHQVDPIRIHAPCTRTQ